MESIVILVVSGLRIVTAVCAVAVVANMAIKIREKKAFFIVLGFLVKD
jgi:hypothetical protein